jgi:hypothetical protein
MKREDIDFFVVEDHHLVIHERLNNWARYVKPGLPVAQAPIWRLGKSNTRQWHEPQGREEVNTIDGQRLEIAVRLLPVPHRDALRWMYVWRSHPAHARKVLKATNADVMRLVRDARSMLMNRGV